VPLYTYELVEGECRLCGGCFELRRPAGRPELQACPVCRKPVRKVIGQVHVPKLLKKPTPSEAKQAGFKLYKKRDKGVYEEL
jgi:hypothetical protein